MQQQLIQLYDEFADAVFRHCYFRVTDREKAKDLVQETYKRAWLHMTNGGDVRNGKAFIFKIANNLIIDTYRKKKDESLDALQENGFDPGHDDYDQILDTMVSKEIVALLDELDPKYRDPIVMRCIDGFSVNEIAAACGESENTVSVRLHRGLRKVRDLAQEREIL